ncbi:M23 family metallopeptidase [Kamptonema cortianum]|nr:M23 family metallopeptidase [Desertifilum sp.]MDK3159843.1 M23 family metallopeptidase [Kamptonema cortianum]
MPIKFSVTFETTDKTPSPSTPPAVVAPYPPVSPPQDRVSHSSPRSLSIPKIEPKYLYTALSVVLLVCIVVPPVNNRLESFVHRAIPVNKPAPANPENSSQATEKLILPTTGPITSGFGWRTHPLSGDRRFHNGTDFGVPTGTPIVAVKSGTVTLAKNLQGYGLSVEIDHGDGSSSFYAHCSKLLVKPGHRVNQGNTIALSGNTGNSTGPHLHFEYKVDGNLVDPEKYLPL